MATYLLGSHVLLQLAEQCIRLPDLLVTLLARLHEALLQRANEGLAHGGLHVEREQAGNRVGCHWVACNTCQLHARLAGCLACRPEDARSHSTPAPEAVVHTDAAAHSPAAWLLQSLCWRQHAAMLPYGACCWMSAEGTRHAAAPVFAAERSWKASTQSRACTPRPGSSNSLASLSSDATLERRGPTNRQLLNQLKQSPHCFHTFPAAASFHVTRLQLHQTASKMDVSDFYGKYKTKVGYTLIVVSIAVFILHHAKPFIEDPNATSTQRQIYGMALVFL